MNTAPGAGALLRSPRYLLVRPLLALAALSVAVASVREAALIRAAESSSAAVILRSVFGLQAVGFPRTADFYLRIEPERWIGLHVATSCSTAMLLPGLAAMTAVLLLLRPLPPLATLSALVAATAVLFTCNLGRILMISLAAEWGGGRGFHLAHTWLGTAVTIAAATLAAGVYLHILSQGKRSRVTRTRQNPTPTVRS
ncbi:exosortase/archaeosortase family protein [Kitasatospora kifunensis]|uniref:Exosortase/archaeosortase family protein n=1 Tax=Kitasatospora kifunensis TaxID=58351 RepID=A0A7W7RAL9_KITKI|nr:exosortase/archaeosortase family protein [Kitasatospora kifunensis]MBB4928163.1 exosortase/archaeosortase family protein [Kitasatospora kifunensis]